MPISPNRKASFFLDEAAKSNWLFSVQPERETVRLNDACPVESVNRSRSGAEVSGKKESVSSPLTLTETDGQYDVHVNVNGGGFSGQAGAIRLGVARALLEVDPDFRGPLKKAGFLTRDPRMKERKKPGLKKARKASQFSKR